MKRTNIGGQAVIEGVMMAGKKMYALAVRTPEGTITVEKNQRDNVLSRHKLFKLPIFRGMAAFVESLITGVKIIMRSAQLAGMEDLQNLKSFFLINSAINLPIYLYISAYAYQYFFL